MINGIARLMRPHQYTKNLFIFLPPFFAFSLGEANTFLLTFLAFASFSFTASAVYIFNDYRDINEDRLHPEKSKRPLASGEISIHSAFFILGICLLVGFGMALYISQEVFILILGYFILNIAYSLKLKHISLIDIAVISIGFVIRLFVGSETTNVDLSHWIIVMTFLLALFLSLAKRRDDVLISQKTNKVTRRVIDGYNQAFLDAAMIMAAAIIILAYILWSITPEVTTRLSSESLYLTSIFVILGIMRYMQITFVEEKSGSPSRILLKDIFIQLILLGWISSFIWLLYLT